MRSVEQLLAILLCAMWCLSPIRAQESAAAVKAGQDVTALREGSCNQTQ